MEIQNNEDAKSILNKKTDILNKKTELGKEESLYPIKRLTI